MIKFQQVKKSFDAWICVVILLIGSMLAILSVMRYRGYNAAMLDLGNMSQAIWSATQGRPLECTYRDGTLSRLALHVEIIYFLFVPIYAVFLSPVTLLILQAFLFAVAGFPLYALALRKLQHKWSARLIVLIYLLYPVAQTAVLFDFHGDTLAMPLLIYLLNALDRRAWREYGLWLFLVLCCKFYVSVAIFGLGITLYILRQRKMAIWTMGTAILWAGLTLFVIKPFFAPSDTSPLEVSFFGYLLTYFGNVRALLDPTNLYPRVVTALFVLGPALWLGWRGWHWLLPAVFIVFPAIITNGMVSAFDYRYHHYAIAVPFIVRGILAGAEFLRNQQRSMAAGKKRMRPWRHELMMQAAIVVLFTAILVDIPLNPLFWLNRPWWGMDSWAYGRTGRDALKDAWLQQHVPPTAPVLTNEWIAPHIINRHTLYLDVDPAPENNEQLASRLDKVDTVVLDALYDYSAPRERLNEEKRVMVTGLTYGHPGSYYGGVLRDSALISYLYDSTDFNLVTMQDGLMLFKRDEVLDDFQPLSYSVEELEAGEIMQETDTHFEGLIALDSYARKPLENRRYELTFVWRALQDLSAMPPYIAVSRLQDVKNARIVHLPTAALLPTTAWRVGVPVEETFEVMLPDSIAPGSYELKVGWYDSSDIYAAFTDARSRLGNEYLVDVITVR